MKVILLGHAKTKLHQIDTNQAKPNINSTMVAFILFGCAFKLLSSFGE